MRQTSGVSRPESESTRKQRLRRREESPQRWQERLWPRFSRVEPLRFRRIPLLAAVLCFAIGESLTKLPTPNARPIILLLLAVLALIALTDIALRRAFLLAVPAVLTLWIAAGLWSAQLQPAPSSQTALLTYADGLSRTVQGRIVRIRTLPARSANQNSDTDIDPDQWDDSTVNAVPISSIDLAVTSIEDVTPDSSRMVPIGAGGASEIGGIRATLLANRVPQSQNQPQLHCGDLIEVTLPLRNVALSELF